MQVVLILLTILSYAFGKFRYDNYTLYKVLPENEAQKDFLRNLERSNSGYDFWNDVSPFVNFVNIMAGPREKEALVTLLQTHEIKFEIPMANVQEAIDKERTRTYSRNSRSISWDAYYELDDIEAWLHDMAVSHSDIVTEVVGGNSYEGRALKGLKISHGSGRRAIVIESGIHAREWLSPSTACYIIEQILTSTDEETISVAKEFDWYIFPVTNPDGYVWSHDEFRLWRKNRKPVGSEFGIDLNRNWNSNWLEQGVDLDPASNTYPGMGPFSEPETRTFSAFLRTISQDVDLYISFHTFSQLMMVPYGNTTDPLDNYYDSVNIGRRAMGALSVRYGTQYVTGNIAEAIYLATGTSVDWVKEHLRVPLVYCYELRDQGTYGHVLPADQILPNHLEVFDSLLELIHQAKRFGYMNSAVSAQSSALFLTVVWVFVQILIKT